MDMYLGGISDIWFRRFTIQENRHEWAKNRKIEKGESIINFLVRESSVPVTQLGARELLAAARSGASRQSPARKRKRRERRRCGSSNTTSASS